MFGISVIVFDMVICVGYYFVDFFFCTFFINVVFSWKEIIQYIYMYVLSGELEMKEKLVYIKFCNVNYFLYV